MIEQLTDEQCDAYRRTRLTFNDMLRQCYKDGYEQALKDLQHVNDDEVVIV